ncbi:MAG: hypothetical protein ACHREM_22165, partial [Polyangiales bacterium]
APTTKCVPYTCESATCATSCAADTDCATGYTCDAATSTCVQGATCSADRTTSTARDGTVSPCSTYLCDLLSGSCGSTCALVTDCAAGFTCDSTGKCVATVAPNTNASGGGCGVARGDTRGHIGGLVALLALAAITRRGRRLKLGAPH